MFRLAATNGKYKSKHCFASFKSVVGRNICMEHLGQKCKCLFLFPLFLLTDYHKTELALPIGRVRWLPQAANAGTWQQRVGRERAMFHAAMFPCLSAIRLLPSEEVEDVSCQWWRTVELPVCFAFCTGNGKRGILFRQQNVLDQPWHKSYSAFEYIIVVVLVVDQL